MIAKYQRQFGFTAVIVTHDVQEAMAASDRVALLDQGRMHFQGTSAEFAQSTDAVVTSFRDSAVALGTALASLRHGGSLQTED
jgi:phospholipid/cholesterol/gamma-HCH transport system ATP-binding protein